MSDVFLAVDPALDTPPYQQIVDQLRASIEGNALGPGTALPTVRQLAGDLALAPNTVARAYAQLQDAGWIVSDGRRGTRVAARVPAADRRARRRVLQETVAKLVAGLQHRGYTSGEIGDELRRMLHGLA